MAGANPLFRAACRWREATCRGGSLLSLALAALVLCAIGARAETLPRPKVDFVAEGTAESGKGSGPAVLRYGSGRMRIDTELDGTRSSLYIELEMKKATLVTVRFGQKIALEIDPERANDIANFLERNARRVGDSTVAGEACDEYEFENAKGRTMRLCMTRDGIALRARDLSRKRLAWQATRLTRAPQDSALFAVPADALPVRLPRP